VIPSTQLRHRWRSGLGPPQPRRRFLVTSGLLVLLFSATGCDFPIWGFNTLDAARVTFFKAERLADRGRYDEAVAMFAKVSEKRPDSPYARMVPEAVVRATVSKAVAGYREGDYAQTDEAIRQLLELRPDTALGLLDSADPGVLSAGRFHTYSSPDEADEDSFAYLVPIATHYGVNDTLKRQAADWVCGRAKDFPHFERCAAPETEVFEADVAGAVERLEGAERGCQAILNLADLCPQELGDELRAVAKNGPIVTLRANVEQVKSTWRKNSEKAARSLRNRGRKIGRACEATEHKRARLEGRMAVHALRDEMYQAMRLSQTHDNYVEENNRRSEQLDGLISAVEDKPWPSDLKKTIQDELRGFQESCE